MNISHPEPAGEAAIEAIVDIRHLSADQLQQLGVSQLAYVKPVAAHGGGMAYAIHAADGSPMAVAGELDLAVAAIRQHEMVPVLVH